MTVEHEERVQIVREGGLERKERIIESRPSTQNVIVSRFSRFVWLVTTVMLVLIAFRFALMLLAANPGNIFASTVYAITGVLVGPFVGLVASPVFQGGAVLDVPSLFALAVYPLIAWALVQLFRIIFTDTRGVRRVKTVQRENIP
jgi:hypothetical protein